MKLAMLFIMLFFHIVADFNLQGILAKMKQRSWWMEQVQDPNLRKLYNYDYLMALILHAFSWTFVVLLPVLIHFVYKECFTGFRLVFYVLLFIINWLVHAFVDNLKANVLSINLIMDQVIHIIQVFLTWLILVVIFW